MLHINLTILLFSDESKPEKNINNSKINFSFLGVFVITIAQFYLIEFYSIIKFDEFTRIKRKMEEQHRQMQGNWLPHEY